MNPAPEDYTKIVNSLKGQLPCLPLLMDELMTIIADHNAALHAIKDIIKIEPAIYSQILKVVNTFKYRGDGEPKIINLNDAMHRLGLEKVKRIALSTSVLSLFRGVKFPNNFSPESLWTHSVGVAVTSSNLAEFIGFPFFDQAYVCGLVHDIGKLAKLKFDQKNFRRELKKAHELGSNNYQIEISENRIRHDLLGGEIAKEWGISPLVEAVATWHHEEDRTKRIDVEDLDLHKLIDLVQFSNFLVKKMKFGNSGHSQKGEPSLVLMRRLKISKIDLNEFEEKLTLELETEKEHLSLFTKD